MKQKIYIAGKVTGLERSVVEKNFDTLKEYFIQKGFRVVSPIDIVTDPATEWKAAMKICIAALMDCDVVYMMNNSQWSKGACLELSIAKAFGITIIDSAVADVTSKQFVPDRVVLKNYISTGIGVSKHLAEHINNRNTLYDFMESMKNKTSHLK